MKKCCPSSNQKELIMAKNMRPQELARQLLGLEEHSRMPVEGQRFAGTKEIKDFVMKHKKPLTIVAVVVGAVAVYAGYKAYQKKHTASA